ncbi:MAG: acetate kinase, partial [bacterium]|nr:acetate kinase [bacterium]
VTAVKNGKSIDTSMGFTPLEGLMMATRAGDVDPGLLLYLQDKEKLSPRRLYELLNRDSGLKGMTGTPDMREVVKRAKSGSIAGRMALEIFCKRAAKAIAAQVISLGGLDQIVFSGGIGENSSEIRRKICEYLRPFGVQLDALKNNSAPAGKAFNKKMSGVLLAWLHADEAAEINRILSSLSI